MGSNCRLVLILGLLAMAIYHVCYSCSVPKRWKVQEVSQRAAVADIVIVGKVANRPYRTARKSKAKERQVGNYNARFNIICTLKGGPLPAFINVSGFGYMPGHCVTSRALQNKTYLGFLRKRNGRYAVAEINVQKGTVLFNQHLLQRVIKKLGMKKHRNACSDIFRKYNQKKAKKSKVIQYRDELAESKRHTTATEWTHTTQSLRHGSNGVNQNNPTWTLSVQLMLYGLVCVLT